MHQPVLQCHHLHPDSGVSVCRRGVLRQVQGELSRLHFTQSTLSLPSGGHLRCSKKSVKSKVTEIKDSDSKLVQALGGR